MHPRETHTSTTWLTTTLNAKYIFFHVERTAGTYLRQLLFEYYGWDTGIVYAHYNLWDGRPTLKPFVESEEIAKAQVIIGHEVYYGMHEVIKEPCYYVVFLREPMERMQSLWNHIRVIETRAGNAAPEFDVWFRHYQIATQVWSLDKEVSTLERAKEIVSNTSFIGLTETKREDVYQLLHIYPDTPPQNTTEVWTRKSGIPPVIFNSEQTARVMAVLDEDYKLYKLAKELRMNGHNKGFRLPL